MDNSPFQNSFNNQQTDPLSSHAFQPQNGSELKKEKLYALGFLLGYDLIVKNNVSIEESVTDEGNLDFISRKIMENTIFEIFDKLFNLSYNNIHTYINKLNNIYPGCFDESSDDDKAIMDAREFVEEVVFESTSKSEWHSLYQGDKDVENFIRETTDLIVNDIILKNFSNCSYYKLSDLGKDLLCEIIYAIHFSLDEAFTNLLKEFDIKTAELAGTRCISGVIIIGLSRIRNGILSNICREILINKSPEERKAFIEYVNNIDCLCLYCYNIPDKLPKDIEVCAENILNISDNIINIFHNANKFLEFKNFLPKLQDLEIKVSNSKYFKNISSPSFIKDSSLYPLGDIIFLLDSSFDPLQIVHLNGRQHYTEFIFDYEKSASIIDKANILERKNDSFLLLNSRDIYLNSNGEIHASYHDRFASSPEDDWYQTIKNILINVDSVFRNFILKEWKECPSLYDHLDNSNPLVYYLKDNKIFSITDKTFPNKCLENRCCFDGHFSDSIISPAFKFFMPSDPIYSQALYLMNSDKKNENTEPNNTDALILNSEDLAWERINKCLPSNGKITLDWLLENLSALGEVEFRKNRGKGSHYIIRVEGYDGFYTFSKDFREQLDDVGCFKNKLKEFLKSIMGDKYSLETFANALEKKYEE